MSTDLTHHALNGPAMGARWSVVFHAAPGRALGALSAELQGAVERIEQQMSLWRSESDLCRLNQAPVGEWIDLPDALCHVIATGLSIGRACGGRFDIAVGGLVAAHGFSPQSAPATFEPALESLELDPTARRLRKRWPVRVDLNGIAKGYGVDQLAEVMIRHHISSWLVGIDGEMRGYGSKPDGKPWSIGIERPDEHARDVMSVVDLTDAAVATSGTYRKFKKEAMRTITHTMNPLNGQPLENQVASVTVLAPTCMLADAWATALLVAGPQEALALAKANGLRVQLILKDCQVLSTMEDGGIQDLTP